jgi:hypothetical protein
LKYGNSLGIAAAEAININRIPASNFAAAAAHLSHSLALGQFARQRAKMNFQIAAANCSPHAILQVRQWQPLFI